MLGILAYLAALAYAALTVNAILQKYPLTLLYTYHPLAASAFIVFAVCGIVTAQSAQKGNHKARITRHGYWQVAATLTALATNAIIYMHKEQKGKPHLQSWHGVAGAATTACWIMLQMSGGLAWYQPSIASKLMPLIKLYIQHGLFGTLAFALLITTHCLALAGGYQGYSKGTTEWYVLGGLLAAMGLGVLAGAGKLFKRAARVFGGSGSDKADNKKTK